jgi:hypothetical protein
MLSASILIDVFTMKQNLNTYNDLEDEKSGHQRKFQAGVFGNALEASEQPQHDWEQHHQHSQEDWREDTLTTKNEARIRKVKEQERKGTYGDDTNNHTRQIANPSEPGCSGAQSVDVGHRTNKRDCSRIQ